MKNMMTTSLLFISLCCFSLLGMAQQKRLTEDDAQYSNKLYIT